MIIYQSLAFLIIIIGAWLAFWVYLSNRKSKTNQLFFLFTISALLWTPLPYFFNLPLFSHLSLYFVRLGYGIVSLFLVIFYFFIEHFPREIKRRPILDKIVILIGIFFFLLSIFTNFTVENIEPTKWGINPVFGQGKIFYFGAAFFLTLITMISLFQKYFILSTKERLQVQYLLMGLTIFVVCNLIVNVMFPFLGSTVQVRYYPVGNYSAIFLLGFTAYAIIKKELLG